MSQSEYRARQVRAKTHEVFEYDHDENKPGKPLHVMVPGGLIALAVLGVIALVAYRTWFEGQLDQDTGLTLITILSPFYVGGVFLFSYGYELYNIPRAIRLTAIIVFVTLAAVVIVAVLFFVLGESKGGSRSSSRSSKSSSSSSKPSAKVSDIAGGFIGAAGSGMKETASKSSSSGGGHYHGGYGGGNIFIDGGTRVETREVTKEVIKEVPKEPMPITCPFCSRSYIPVDHKYICPSCGAATPKHLIEESQQPKSDTR